MLDKRNLKMLKAVALTGLLMGLGFSIPLQAQFYFQNFDSVRGVEISEAGFTGHGWTLNTAGSNKFMFSASHTRAAGMSSATSPEFPFTTDRELNLGFTVQYQLQFPGMWETSPPESLEHMDDRDPAESPEQIMDDSVHRRRLSITSVDLLDPVGQPLFTLAFRPNPPADIDDTNLILINHRTGQREFAKTGTVTPFGTESESGTVSLKIAFQPTSFQDSAIQVFYAENGKFRDTPLIVHKFPAPVPVNRLRFRHRSGRRVGNDAVQVDEISVRPNGQLLFSTQLDDVFDRELLTSDGSNTSDVFDVRSYIQATFRLAQSNGGEGFVGDWSKFLEMINLVKNGADSIHGIPLLITKAEFTILQPNAPPQNKTFFMATFAAKTIFHQDITIVGTPVFQLSADPVASIQLKAEGTTVEVDPAGNTPLHFSSPGEKTVLATVRFASGFVGENQFRVIVELD